MNYLESIAYIESLSPTLERPSLARITSFLDDNQGLRNKYPVFHVGGTNGKGSTVAILDTLLRECGLRVGRFTGPHLLRWNERFHVDGVAIDDEQFADLATKVRRSSQAFAGKHPELGPLTWFEFLTVMALSLFAEQDLDVAVFEVGLGGRFDATAILENVLCAAVTNIDLDHTHILGETYQQIAFEKGGIFKRGVPALTAAAVESALFELRQRAAGAGAPFYTLRLPAQLSVTEGGGTTEIRDDQLWRRCAQQFVTACRTLKLPGEHQKLNALVALSSMYLAAQRSTVWRDLLEKRLLAGAQGCGLVRAFKNVYWPGRLQVIESANVVLDGAHNPAGARILRCALDELFPRSNLSFVLSLFANKNAKEMLTALVRKGDRVFISEAASRRATCSKEELAAIAAGMGAHARTFETIALALEAAIERRDSAEPIVATGSFATVREVMAFLGWQSVEDGSQESAGAVRNGVGTVVSRSAT